MLGFKRFLKEEEAAGVVELILITVVLVALVAFFKKNIDKILQDTMKEIKSHSTAIQKKVE